MSRCLFLENLGRIERRTLKIGALPFSCVKIRAFLEKPSMEFLIWSWDVLAARTAAFDTDLSLQQVALERTKTT